jgi:hypothetical protein
MQKGLLYEEHKLSVVYLLGRHDASKSPGDGETLIRPQIASDP